MPEVKENSDLEKIPTIEADDTIIKVVFVISKATWKKLGEIALDRETSRSDLMREAIKQYIEKLEKPEEQNQI
jgi:predicted transcriptional regulator